MSKLEYQDTPADPANYLPPSDEPLQVSDVRGYLVSYTVLGGGETGDEVIWAADAEKAIRNLREKIRREHQPGDDIRRLGIVIDSVALEE
jgi:hypothetical protein